MSKVILTDIEGTTSSIAFVKDVLFPYAAKSLPKWLKENCNNAAARVHITSIAQTLGVAEDNLEAVTKQLLSWIADDVKAPPLKALQGMIWETGYTRGDYKAHIYDDAIQKLQDWQAAGIPLYVYSSGSIHAQQLFFQYSRYGDVRNLFSGHFDTTSGAKMDAESYRKICSSIDQEPADVLFLSDVEAEIDAAKEAGLDAVLIDRPEDRLSDANVEKYTTARNFHEVSVTL